MKLTDGVKTEYVEELRYGDKIFPTKMQYMDPDINEDYEYKEPHVRTWYYTNIEHYDVYVKDDIPMPVRFNNNLHKYKTEPGVFIIKRFSIPNGEIRMAADYIRYIGNADLDIPKEELNKIINKLNLTLEDTLNNEPIVIRLVHFISKHRIDNSNIVLVDNLMLTKDMDLLSRRVSNERGITAKGNNGSNLIKIDYYSNTESTLKINLLGRETTLYPFIDKSLDLDSLVVSYTGSNGKFNNFTILPEELDKFGIIKSEETIDEHELLKTYANFKIEQLETANRKLKGIQEFRKYLIEHDISLQKLYAYIAKVETAKITLEKEEVSKMKELIKTVTSFL